VISYMQQMYVQQVESYTSSIDGQRKELEVYTQLLRHDLRNDLQAILSSIEMASLSLEVDSAKSKAHLARSLKLGERMVSILRVFSMPLLDPDTNLVNNIREVAELAERTYPNLEISVSFSNDAQKATLTSSRLLSMVWTNIFRNSALYAGSTPKIFVDITLKDGMFNLEIRDNGPGIPEPERDWIFKRGSANGSNEHGQGLYLSKIVLESHGGSIELLNSQDWKGAEFLIKIPVNSSH